MERKLTESDKRILKIFREEWGIAKDQERKNTAEMPRLSGYIEALEYCISHIIAEDDVSKQEGVKDGI